MLETGRRKFLTFSGALLGGIAVGSQVTAATRTDRFIAETRGNRVPKDVDVVHEMPGVKFVVVEGREKDLKKSRAVKDYAPDIEVELDDPDVNSEAPTAEEASVADEPYYPLQWDKQDLDIETAHETTKGEGTRVTIIDTGVAAGHDDLVVKEKLSRNFTGDGFGAGIPAGGFHGTHVGGIVAAQTDNEVGVAGTAPETDLVDCRVFSPNALASLADILAAVVYSANIDADVANLSLGAYPLPRQGIGQLYGKALNRTMTYANKEGTLLAIAAGNDSADLQHDKNLISLPNEGAQGLSIAATGPIGFGWDPDSVGDSPEPPRSPAIYTNYGTNAIDLAAPGGDFSPAGVAEDEDEDDVNPDWYLDLVLSTIAEPQFRMEDVDGDGEEEPVEYLGASYGYAWVAGTSMAAPQVAGGAALVKSANPNYNANQVESALERAADVPEDYDKTYYGSGYLNIVDAL
jgi:subtilisin family serine protease